MGISPPSWLLQAAASIGLGTWDGPTLPSSGCGLSVWPGIYEAKGYMYLEPMLPISHSGLWSWTSESPDQLTLNPVPGFHQSKKRCTFKEPERWQWNSVIFIIFTYTHKTPQLCLKNGNNFEWLHLHHEVIKATEWFHFRQERKNRRRHTIVTKLSPKSALGPCVSEVKLKVEDSEHFSYARCQSPC